LDVEHLMRKSNTPPFSFKSLLLGLCLIISLPVTILLYLDGPTGNNITQEVRITSGMNARQIGEMLQEKKLVRQAFVFEWTARLQGVTHRLEAGTYPLDGSESTSALLQRLLEAPLARQQRVTVPEGLTRHQIAALFQRQGMADSAQFIALCEDSGFIQRLGMNVPTLEGYLFPETYFFDTDTGAETIIQRLTDQFSQVFSDTLQAHLQTINLTAHQALILASIVEREAQIAAERPLIAAVFLRRLELNRRLESCATVEYAMGYHKERLTNADLDIDSPFNTYQNRGLPPGPICSPGQASLKAVLYPDKTEYLYFVARGDGSHTFSRTHREHNAAKRAIRQGQL
jgi:UPF0755 protein